MGIIKGFLRESLLGDALEQISRHIKQLQVKYIDLQLSVKKLKKDIASLTQDFFEIKNLSNELRKSKEDYDRLIRLEQKIIEENAEMSQRMKAVLGTIEVAVDVHEYHPKSWAVVCVDGNPSYVKMVDLSKAEARDILGFLKTFEYDSTIVDAHPDFKRYYNFENGRI